MVTLLLQFNTSHHTNAKLTYNTKRERKKNILKIVSINTVCNPRLFCLSTDSLFSQPNVCFPLIMWFKFYQTLQKVKGPPHTPLFISSMNFNGAAEQIKKEKKNAISRMGAKFTRGLMTTTRASLFLRDENLNL